MSHKGKLGMTTQGELSQFEYTGQILDWPSETWMENVYTREPQCRLTEWEHARQQGSEGFQGQLTTTKIDK